MSKIALLGYGVVARGVLEVLAENGALLARRLGAPLEVKSILVRRDFPGDPNAGKFVRDFAGICADPEIEAVVEVMGGEEPAYTYTAAALRAGKHVVTANKQLLAHRGQELLDIAGETGVNYLFEASVGGGIPILRPLRECLSANRVDEVCGILNGTTNYILTEMIQCGTDFSEALSQAQALGYAEADPTADVEGLDAQRKICILADLAFGRNMPPEAVSAQGIRAVSREDVEYAQRLGCVVKLLGRALRLPDGTAAAYVAPHFISKANLLSHVDGVMNGIVVRGNAVGECLFYGPGAGGRATASAVVSDVVDALLHASRRKDWGWAASGAPEPQSAAAVVSRWFLRTDAGLAPIGAAFGNVQFLSHSGAPAGEYAFLTPPMTETALLARVGDMPLLSRYRVLD